MRRFILGWKQQGYEQRAYIGTRPSKAKIARIKDRISQQTSRSTQRESTADQVKQLNAVLRGWGNYVCLGPVSKAYRAVDAHTRYRLRQWLRHKHKVPGAGTRAFPDEYLYEGLGLVRLEATTCNLPWAKA